MASAGYRHLAFLVLGALVLAGCGDGTNLFKPGPSTDGAPDTASAPARAGRSAGADVEAPEVFKVTAQGLWDGRPSLGGVWVASPDARDPERVIIRNDASGETVIGALFRRERENPGPPIQISSDAAEALGLLAGQPATVTITALRRAEDRPAAAAAPATAAADPATPETPAQPVAPAETVATKIATPDAGAVAAATEKADVPAPVISADALAKAAPPASTAASSPAAGSAPFIRLGIFRVEANAKRAAGTVTRTGASAALRKEESKGKTYWSVVAGPAASAADRDALMKKINGLGFADAYFVSR